VPGPMVTSPQLHGHRWRVGVRAAAGCPVVYRSFQTRREAEEYAVIARQELRTTNRTLAELLELYTAHQVEQGSRETTRTTTAHRLRGFFGGVLDLTLAEITEARAKALYKAAQQGRAVDTHQAMLRQAKTFLKWCVKERWLPASPFEYVEPVGRKAAGKPQLRIDEARRWVATAAELARAGDEGALAAILALLCGLRTSEIVARVVRDLDDNGTRLVVDASKTAAGVRVLELPEPLRELLQARALAVGGLPTARLFPYKREWVRRQVHRICAAAGVRGTHATVATRAGATPALVTASLGHEHHGVTRRHYLAPGALQAQQQDHLLEVLGPGLQTSFHGPKAKGPEVAPGPSVRRCEEGDSNPHALSGASPSIRLAPLPSLSAGFPPDRTLGTGAGTAPAGLEAVLVAALAGVRSHYDPTLLLSQLAEALALVSHAERRG